MGVALDLNEPGIGYALYPHYHALLLPLHLRLFIQRPSNNLLTPVQVYIVYRLGECVEDNMACMAFMGGDGQEVEVMYSVFVADLDTNIAVCGQHLHLHIDRNREFP